MKAADPAFIVQIALGVDDLLRFFFAWLLRYVSDDVFAKRAIPNKNRNKSYHTFLELVLATPLLGRDTKAHRADLFSERCWVTTTS